MIRLIAIFTGISGFLGVAFGAFGSHALRGQLSLYEVGVWNTAVQYQLLHSVALLVLIPMLLRQSDNRCLKVAGVLFAAGITFFSGSLYLLVLSGSKALVMLTPLGGITLLFGWVMLSFGLVRLAASERSAE